MIPRLTSLLAAFALCVGVVSADAPLTIWGSTFQASEADTIAANGQPTNRTETQAGVQLQYKSANLMKLVSLSNGHVSMLGISSTCKLTDKTCSPKDGAPAADVNGLALGSSGDELLAAMGIAPPTQPTAHMFVRNLDAALRSGDYTYIYSLSLGLTRFEIVLPNAPRGIAVDHDATHIACTAAPSLWGFTFGESEDATKARIGLPITVRANPDGSEGHGYTVNGVPYYAQYKDGKLAVIGIGNATPAMLSMTPPPYVAPKSPASCDPFGLTLGTEKNEFLKTFGYALNPKDNSEVNLKNVTIHRDGFKVSYLFTLNHIVDILVTPDDGRDDT